MSLFGQVRDTCSMNSSCMQLAKTCFPLYRICSTIQRELKNGKSFTHYIFYLSIFKHIRGWYPQTPNKNLINVSSCLGEVVEHGATGFENTNEWQSNRYVSRCCRELLKICRDYKDVNLIRWKVRHRDDVKKVILHFLI